MILAAVLVGIGAGGTYLLLPHRHGAVRARMAHGGGAVAVAVALLAFMVHWSPPGPLLARLFLYIFGVMAIAGGVLTVTSRDPVNCALWFAAVVLSTSGLFLLADAPFLAAGTIIVYAGAIIVTFLFVIMLAQMEGRADYDRAARAPGTATFTCSVILWCLIVSVATIRAQPPVGDPAGVRGRISSERNLIRSRDRVAQVGAPTSAAVEVLETALTPTSQTSEAALPSAEGEISAERITKPNVAGLGTSLYTDQLVTVAIAGALLFVALVGAVAITNPRRPVRPGADPTRAAAVETIGR